MNQGGLYYTTTIATIYIHSNVLRLGYNKLSKVCLFFWARTFKVERTYLYICISMLEDNSPHLSAMIL